MNGLLDKYDMLDELDRNLEKMTSVNGIGRCGLIWNMHQIIEKLKTGIRADEESLRQELEDLRRRCGIESVPVEQIVSPDEYDCSLE